MKKLFALLLSSLPLFAQSADVGLTAHTLHPRIPGGTTSDIFVTVSNDGPDVARNVRLTFVATAGLTLKEIHATDCVNHIENVVCTFGELPRGASRDVTVLYDFPLGEATHFVQAEVTSDTPDPDPFDNKAPVQIDTVKTAAANPFFDSARGRADPGGTFTGRVFLGSEVPVPPGTRIDLRISTTNGVVENIGVPSSWTCTYEGSSAHCTATASSELWNIPFTIRASDDRAGGPAIVRAEGRAHMEGHDLTGVSEMTLDVYRHIVVTTIADSGAGSLRDAMHAANASCSPGPCKIVFELEPGATIVPATPLPHITADRVVLEAATPVVIDGSTAGEGLELHAACEGSVRGLTLRNFRSNQGLSLHRTLCPTPNLGDSADITGNVIERNLRGLRIDGMNSVRVERNVIRDNTYSGVWMWSGFANFFDNTIERNGASGIFLGPGVRGTIVVGNTMSDHPHMGVAIAKGAQQIDVRTNTILRSGVQSIDWGINGRDPANDADADTENNPPVLLSAIYDSSKNVTRVTMTLRTFLLPPGRAILEFFVDDRPYTSGDATRVDGAPFTFDLHGDHRGKWITATSTRAHYLFAKPPRGASSNSYSADQANTSEISNAVLAQ